jgi:hypothetical protein
MSTSVPDDLVPRRYQEEVFAKAQKGHPLRVTRISAVVQ